MKVSTMTETDKAGQGTMDDRRKRLSETQQNGERLKQLIALAHEREGELLAERGKLLPSARLRNNAQAQQRVGTIDAELARVRTGIADDETVLAAQISQSESIETDIVRFEWEGRRAAVRDLLNRRLEGKTVASLTAAIGALNKAFKDLADEDLQIGSALSEFDSEFRAAERTLRVVGEYRGRLVGYHLRGVVPKEGIGHYMSLYKGRDLLTIDRAEYGRILESLDSLELVF